MMIGKLQNGVLRTAAIAVVLLLTLAVRVSPAEETPDALAGPVEADPEAAAEAAVQSGGEALHMRWKLGGFLGTLASLFVPSTGDALITYVPQPDEQLRIQFLVTAPKREGEYFLYGADIDQGSGATTEVWSSSLFRGEREDKGEQIDSAGVIDFASVIHQLQVDPPRTIRAMTIWNSGKTYPVEVEPLEPETRKISGVRRAVRGYLVRGVVIKGEPAFKDKFFLYFTREASPALVEIIGKRGLVRVRFQVVDKPPAE